ncbi:MAG: phospho-N-acetylmuramoyl-pentapeptide-transferase [Deltaproteobacteria bacterium RIFCSPLOWO2_01_44_7]|nr:MAG: phospho-N-acetylmuramoyl-pentapeptide-transferase [Deltaproteobacteria bacterium RIFCSPHIGHO2_01_FULL_43_49]OGQ14311.1 MAG: phospho-N-acetylmuramoyl-pentapeptide-transferase [Deltaproteobacteria bacterium RIFCSPHIGHO2_02_FULL_44_53]OGQ27649.1 MAG: phospho-N-acetylmuramoyl-pentapeptide-transferase [Deltaproteobacteria bacterium RIFCSPHIGHO2_12_FULL_44_21]OGQ30752.1 MAG: phospho-N-acetylmuramoyl-pentapeptide-transferase [Deltaproteobacteria bacterium RIFCSPLOWO2_01_FULL_45_74]OGQ41137.1 M
MLYHWLYPLHDQLVAFNVIKYITFRTFMGLFTSLGIVFVLGKPWIAFLQRHQLLQTLWEYVPETHHKTKAKTPTMGGILIWFAFLLSTLLWARWDNPFVWMMLGLGSALGAIGFLDDYWKISRKDAHGLKARYKFPLQVLVCGLVALILYDGFGFNTELSIPFMKQISPDLGMYYIILAILVLVGTSNAVNLTDGLDGLVTGPAIIAFMTYGVFAYIAGHIKIASYLQVPYVPQCGELSILCGAIAGALIGFLWFNSHPAQLFMGDVGALSIGGMLGLVALLTKNELLLVVIGGVFVLETLSVITQVVSFKLRGKRIFRMAPLHHHFELKGWPESKVIVRFWIISMILALASMSTLKLR